MASCAATTPASLPVVTAAAPVERDRSDWVPVAYDGRVGVWVSEDALGDLLAGFEKDKGALKVEIAKSRVGEQLATERADAVTRNARALELQAKIGPWLGFGGGLTVAGIVALIVWGVVRR